EARGKPAFSVHWTGLIHPSDTGEYLIGIRAAGSARVSVDKRQIVQMYSAGATLSPVHLERDHPLRLDLDYGRVSGTSPRAELIWARVNEAPDPAAIAAARDAEVIVAVVGITSRLEGEEMQIEQPGFLGGDRT